MAANSTGSIIDQQVFSDLDKLSDKIVQVEGRIDSVNGKTISIIVDLKGAESLNAIVEGTNKANAAITELNQTIGESKAIAQQATTMQTQYGKSISEGAEKLAEMRVELADVTNKIAFH